MLFMTFLIKIAIYIGETGWLIEIRLKKKIFFAFKNNKQNSKVAQHSVEMDHILSLQMLLFWNYDVTIIVPRLFLKG